MSIIIGRKPGGSGGGGGAPSGPAGGDLGGTYPNPDVDSVQANAVDTNAIQNGAVTAAKVAADVATQAELDAVSTVASAALVGAVLFDSTLGGAAASIDTGAGGFATTHDLLLIYALLRTTEVATFSAANITLNADGGANYDNSIIRNTNTTLVGVSTPAQTSWGLGVFGASAAASNVAMMRLEIFGYGQTTFFKQARTIMSYVEQDAADSRVDQRSLQWRSTAAINRITVTAGSGNLVAGSRLTVYGIG